MMARRKGFSLPEILIFIAIFSVAIVAFLGIMVLVFRIQNNQSSSTEVAQQGQFLMQQIQYYVEGSSIVDIPQDASTSTLKLWLGISGKDPTYITLASGTVYLQQTATGTLQALTSNKVTVSNLSFARHANPPGHDAVNVSFTIAYDSPNPVQAISQLFQTSIARVSAATFDSNLIPSSTNLNVGLSGAAWSSINQTINFNGSNVGIGVSGPADALDVAGAVKANGDGSSVSFYIPNGYAMRDGTVGASNYFDVGTMYVRDGNGATTGGKLYVSQDTWLAVAGGKVGIGTTTPSYLLDVASGGASTTRLGTQSSDTVIVGGGSGKITAGTFDPAYLIGGQGFATYLPGMTGEKEETAGTVTLTRAGSGAGAVNGGYQAILDFAAAPQDSDLWLFRKVIDASNNFSGVSAFLTPGFAGNVWYEKDAAHNRIVIHGSAPGEVSYQLIGRRFDWASWSNETGAPQGIVVPASQ